MNVLLFAVSLLMTMGGLLLVVRGEPAGWPALAFFGVCSLVLLVPLLPRSWFKTGSPFAFLSALQEPQAPSGERYGTLEIDASGIRHALADGREVWIAWNEIDRVVAFKRDLLATDQICLLIGGRFAASPYELHEDMPGFEMLHRAMGEALPSVPDTWFLDVMTPAFETNETLVFEREGHGSA